MLLFIPSYDYRCGFSSEFQYITCYSLSFQICITSFDQFRLNTSHVTLYQKCHFPIQPNSMCFNTSHVTLYRRKILSWLLFCPFQYITCYSLSRFVCGKAISTDMFQYITCYSLSLGNCETSSQSRLKLR